MDQSDLLFDPSQPDFSFPQLNVPELLTGYDDLDDAASFLSSLASVEPSNSTGGSASTMGTSSIVYPEFHILDTSPQSVMDSRSGFGFSAMPSSAGIKRKRSTIACRACHDRRVRCDAAAGGLPCSNCRWRDVECAFIDSKRSRGRGGRFKERTDNSSEHSKPSNRFPPEQLAQREHHATTPREDTAMSERESSGPEVGSNVRAAQKSDSSQALLNTGGQMVYVGEPSLLVWLLSDKTGSKRLHRTIEEAQPRNDNEVSPQPPANTCEELLTPEVERELLDSFYHNFLPLYPILNKKDTVERWRMGTVPPLLKYSILVMGALHAPADTLTKAGFPCKQDAVDMLYRKARQMYDDDDDLDRVCVIQSSFMLQFRFGSTMGHRDCFWWAGGAVNTAQTIGMHRSTKGMAMGPKEYRLWKKIWWLLFIRDRQLASGMGKPMMIDERDCDVQELTLDDFVDGETPETAHFTISMMRFAKIITQVVRCRFTPASSSNEATKLEVHLALQAWHAQLHPSMQYDCKSNRTRYSVLLSLVYHWMALLLHRPSVDDAKDSLERRDFSTQLAFHSANKINELAGDISKSFNVNEFPIYAYVCPLVVTCI
ncbi:Zn(2)-C6 fungal-type domain-containing protein [Fusarium sp. LHS14.1]|nr:Zn(2)-C6 fungal-type domain-containing protein [Fusarium sp. LHS14.1]